MLSLLTLLSCYDILLVEKADVSVTGKVPISVLPVETSAFLLFIFSSLCTLIDFHHTFINLRFINNNFITLVFKGVSLIILNLRYTLLKIHRVL